METIRTFMQLRQWTQMRAKRRRIAAVQATDEATRRALAEAEREGLAEVTNVCLGTPEASAAEAVRLVREGEADVLMKGLIGTDQLLRAVLNKEAGLLPQGHVLTHISAAEMPTYHKMLFFTDAAVIPYPTQEQRTEQVRYAVRLCHALGNDEPRIALIHCSEKPSKKFPFVDGYEEIKQMAADGVFGRCIVDGPLDVKSACSLHALEAKGITSPLAGRADVLVMPDIEAGNAFYKSMTLFAGARTAGILCGTTAPVVVPSRGDSAEAKLNSIVLALASI